jgi:hypothetical protein
MAPRLSPKSRQELEDLWRERVEALRLEYSRSSADCHRFAEFQNQLPAPDGAYRLTQALRVEAEARRKFTEAVVTFSRLVIHGIAPEE